MSIWNMFMMRCQISRRQELPIHDRWWIQRMGQLKGRKSMPQMQGTRWKGRRLPTHDLCHVPLPVVLDLRRRIHSESLQKKQLYRVPWNAFCLKQHRDSFFHNPIHMVGKSLHVNILDASCDHSAIHTLLFSQVFLGWRIGLLMCWWMLLQACLCS